MAWKPTAQTLAEIARNARSDSESVGLGHDCSAATLGTLALNLRCLADYTEETRNTLDQAERVRRLEALCIALDLLIRDE